MTFIAMAVIASFAFGFGFKGLIDERDCKEKIVVVQDGGATDDNPEHGSGASN
jgi:hypothetical protein